MSPEFLEKWAHIIADVDKHAMPIEFIEKVIVRLKKRKQHTINVARFIKQGMTASQVEDLVSRKLTEFEPIMNSFEIILNIENIAEIVEPETQRLLNKL